MTISTLLGEAGRIIFGLFFVIAGLRNFAGLAKRAPDRTNYGWVLPVPVVAFGFALQLVAGALVIANWQVVPAAMALIVFLFAATAMFHNPLMFAKADRGLHLYLFLVNCTLTGGLLLVISQALSG